MDRELEDTIRYDIALGSLWILPDEITVDASGGVVTLRGTVADRLTANILARMSRELDGVLAVVDKLSWRDEVAA